MLEKSITDCVRQGQAPVNNPIWTAFRDARNFVLGCQIGEHNYKEIGINETLYGPSTGFVYFAAIGDPYITHVKIGYTSANPAARIATLQTACPFKIRLLGYVFGNLARETELHGLFDEQRTVGEWFEYTSNVAEGIDDMLNESMEEA